MQRPYIPFDLWRTLLFKIINDSFPLKLNASYYKSYIRIEYEKKRRLKVYYFKFRCLKLTIRSGKLFNNV